MPVQSPGPSSANANLGSLTQKESFTNDAVQLNGDWVQYFGMGKSASAALVVTYDPADSSYVLTLGDRTEKFAPSNKLNRTASDIYEVATDHSTDRLILLKPGTAGPLTFTYVGGGIWDHFQPGTEAGHRDSNTAIFTYGIETPDANMPHTGSANYDVTLFASQVFNDFYGLGTLTVDFAGGTFSVDVPAGYKFDEPVYAFNAVGQLGSGNNFAGRFSANMNGNQVGTINGRFYGPDAQEVGATFYSDPAADYSTSNAYNETLAGFIVGRKNATPVTNTTLLNLSGDVTLDSGEGVEGFYGTSLTDGSQTFGRADPASKWMSYDSSTQSWTVHDLNKPSDTYAGSLKTVSVDGRYYVYDKGNGTVLKVFRPGSGNTQLALTYVSFFKEQYRTVEDRVNNWTVYNAFGLRTKVLPTTGTGHYVGILVGSAFSNTHRFDLTGTTDLTADFAARSLTGAFTIGGTELQSGTNVNFGSIPITASITSENYLIGSSPASYSWQISGKFYGPTASEVGGSFVGDLTDPLNGDPGLHAMGAYVAKR